MDTHLWIGIISTLIMRMMLLGGNVWATTCYFLWTLRNKIVHDPEFVMPYASATVISQYVHNYT